MEVYGRATQKLESWPGSPSCNGTCIFIFEHQLIKEKENGEVCYASVSIENAVALDFSGLYKLRFQYQTKEARDGTRKGKDFNVGNHTPSEDSVNYLQLYRTISSILREDRSSATRDYSGKTRAARIQDRGIGESSGNVMNARHALASRDAAVCLSSSNGFCVTHYF
jgi:hypothetical protein